MTETPNKGRASGITVLVLFGIAILTFGVTIYFTWQIAGNLPERAPTSAVQTAGAEPTVVETDPEE